MLAQIPLRFQTTSLLVVRNRYVHVGTASSAVGIATTTFVGAANTTFLPGENLFAVKIDDNTIKIASSAENALKSIPQVVELESVGIGTSHRFISTNQNAKVIVAIDNVIQSPVVSTAVTSHLANQMLDTDNILTFSGITSFFGSDLIKIGDEIMKIEGVGIGSTNFIRVRREWLGTKIGTAGTGDLITKVDGNYNIVDNHLNFVEAHLEILQLDLLQIHRTKETGLVSQPHLVSKEDLS